jgi:dsDNA-specific endonuclease/ATPase MutS2
MSESRSIDLHERTVAEAIREFVRFYNSCVRSGYRGRLEVIHGYGSSGSGGVIREELRKFLKAQEETFGEFLAGESLRNPGVTILYPRETLAAMPLGLGGGISSVGYKKPFRKPS